MITNKNLIERFIRYAKIDTQSSEESTTRPSTAKQYDLAKVLVDDLNELGAKVDYDEEHCYVYAYVPGVEPALGLVAHMDTSPAASGADVKPRILENYNGKDEFLDPAVFPELKLHLGEDLIATDGTTLLGADDKAGIAEILEMIAYYKEHPELSHRALAIAFTPDEEIGMGTCNFDAERFLAKEAYTVDGGKLGELEYECFNAAKAAISFKGKSVHPGSAKNLMVNASLLAMEFQSMLPACEVPEHTEGYEGFYHLVGMEGDVENAVLKYIIRDHDGEILEKRKAFMERIADYMNMKYGSDVVTINMVDQYRNMAEAMKDSMHLIENARKAMAALGVAAVDTPVRGGTDGAALSYMGIPCPNLCTGGYNYHGRFEYASIQEMETMVKVLIELVKK